MWENEKMLVTSIFSYSHRFQKAYTGSSGVSLCEMRVKIKCEYKAVTCRMFLRVQRNCGK